jgi:hypothetical protein
MAKIAPPPRRSRVLAQAEQFKEELTPNHLATPTDTGAATFVDLNFKVEPNFHARFRIVAAKRRLKMKELLVAAFQTYLEVHGINE